MTHSLPAADTGSGAGGSRLGRAPGL